jgi:hypothetical protein
MAHLAKIEYAEQIRKDQELHNQIMAERAQQTYRKHYDLCADILGDIVDFTCKVGEYRELTNRFEYCNGSLHGYVLCCVFYM